MSFTTNRIGRLRLIHTCKACQSAYVRNPNETQILELDRSKLAQVRELTAHRLDRQAKIIANFLPRQ